MTDAYRATLHNPVQAYPLILKAWDMAKALTIAGHRVTLIIRPEARSDAQNSLLHATLTEIADQREWAGKKHDVETWKRLLTAAWLRARGEQIEVLPALDGQGVDIVFRKTSTLSKAECSELVEFIEAWRAGA